jgi:hypothetical protein
LKTEEELWNERERCSALDLKEATLDFMLVHHHKDLFESSFGVRVFILVETEETQNTNIVGDFITFPKSGKTPDFDTG